MNIEHEKEFTEILSQYGISFSVGGLTNLVRELQGAEITYLGFPAKLYFNPGRQTCGVWLEVRRVKVPLMFLSHTLTGWQTNVRIHLSYRGD